MAIRQRAPAGPRAAVGREAEAAAAAYLAGLSWTILWRNLRVGADELDIVALEPGSRPTIVVVEVRSRSGPGFGSPLESVDRAKVARLYRGLLALRSAGGIPGLPSAGHRARWRVDLVALSRQGSGPWRVERHVRGLAPP